MTDKKKLNIFDFQKKETMIIPQKNNKLLLPLNNFDRNFTNKTADLTLGIKKPIQYTCPTPRTNLEKVIETLNDIAEEFEILEMEEYKNKTEWVIKEILSNKMYKYDTKSQNSKDDNKFFQLYCQDFDEDENKISNSSILKEDEREYDDESQLSQERSQFVIQIKPPSVTTSTLSLFKPIDISSFGVNFDVFEYAQRVGRENLMSNIFKSVLSYKECSNLLKSSYVDNFIEELRKGYTSEKDAFYHNDYHATDVMQGCLDMMTTGKLDKIAELSQLDILSVLFSAVIHDFKHPGYNNGFLINSKSEIAIQFNGK
jgi:hypothetical protein